MIKLTPNYDYRKIRTKNGTKKQKFLKSLTYQIMENRLKKFLKKNQKNMTNDTFSVQKQSIIFQPKIDKNQNIYSYNSPLNPILMNQGSPVYISQHSPAMNGNFFGFPNNFNNHGHFQPQMNRQPFGPLSLNIIRPNPNILNFNYNGRINHLLKENEPQAFTKVKDQNIPPFVNINYSHVTTYGVNVNQIDEYSTKKST